MSTNNVCKQYLISNMIKNNRKNLKTGSYSEDSIKGLLKQLADNNKISSDIITEHNIKKLKTDLFKLSQGVNSVLFDTDFLKHNIEIKKNFDIIKDTYDDLSKDSTILIQSGGFLDSLNGVLWGPYRSTFGRILDLVQLCLDIIGMIPIAGEIFDAAGVVMSLLRGDWEGALWSCVDLIPIIGPFIGDPIKYFRRFKKTKKLVEEAEKAKKLYSESERLKKAWHYAKEAKEMKEKYYDTAMDTMNQVTDAYKTYKQFTTPTESQQYPQQYNQYQQYQQYPQAYSQYGYNQGY